MSDVCFSEVDETIDNDQQMGQRAGFSGVLRVNLCTNLRQNQKLVPNKR